MSQRNFATTSVLAVLLLAGCSQYAAGNRDRERCEGLRVGMPRSEVISQMGPPRHVITDPGSEYAEEVLVYNYPSMSDLPIFGADKDVEVLMERGPAGLVLKEALC